MAEENKQEEMVKVQVYIPKTDYLRLKSRLALMSTTVSDWFRQKIKNFLNTD